MITLVLGGEKSGKSDVALEHMAAGAAPHAFVATGKARDRSFRARIAKHRAERPVNTPVLEAGSDLAGVLNAARGEFATVLVDSLDFWLFSCGNQEKYVTDLLCCLDSWDKGDIILVSCEVGLGPVAANAETRAFVRNLGALNRAVARRADRAYLVCAGMPLQLKPQQGW